jgi:rod shape determining protein RodA
VRRERGIFSKIDWVMAGIFLVLVVFGWLNIYAAVYDENHTSIFDISQRYGKQMIWIIAAFLMVMVTLLLDPKLFSQFAYLIYAACILILVGVIFGGKEVSGSKSWFQIGSFALQPAEFAKLGTALAIAKYLSAQDISMKSPRTWFTLGVIILLPAALILLQKDTGSALVFIAFLIVLYRAGLSGFLMLGFLMMPVLGVLSLVMNRLILAGILLGIAVVMFLYTKKRLRQGFIIFFIWLASVGFVFSVNYGFQNILKTHQRERIKVLLGQRTDLKGAGYNVNQSLIAIGSGKLFGKGFLQGTQTKYNFVPEQSTDFIFCTVGEEWGFLGSFAVVALYMWLLVRILTVAERQRSKFSRIFGYCVASLIFFHVIINIGMTLGLLPVIGIPLPFLSYGGSSLWAFTLLLFIFVRQDSYRYELV